MLEKTKITIREKEIKEIALLTDELIKGSKAIYIEELVKTYVDRVVDEGEFKPLMISEYRENNLSCIKIKIKV